MIIAQQTRLDRMKPLEELTLAEQTKMVTKAEEEIRSRDYVTLADFKNYMERKYPRARAV